MNKKINLFCIMLLCFMCLSGCSSKSDNPLMNLKIQTKAVMNGTKTEQIGTSAYVDIKKSDMRSVTGEQLYEFAMAEIEGKSYNWFTICLGDGTGIIFTGCYTYVISYVDLDTDNASIKTHSDYIVSNGSYVLVE